MTMPLFLLLSLCCIGTSIFALLYPHVYFSELLLSFTPYIIVISVLGFFYTLTILQRPVSSDRIKICVCYIILLLLSLLGYFSIGLIFGWNYFRFYATDVPQIQAQTVSGYKVLYANIYKNNQDYTGIKKLIDDIDSDVIFFVEFADHHSDFFQEHFAKKYPYSNRTTWSKDFIGSVVFSKFPIQNWADDFPQGAWRYAYFSIGYEDSPIYFYLVHMSSPSTSHYFDIRNQQIKTFFKDFDLHKQDHRSTNDKVVVLGDFNTTPWSVYYKEFAQGFAGDFINVTRDYPFLFTWKLLSFPLAQAQIDHIFVNNLIQVSDFNLVDVPGSDHKGFTFVVR